MPPPKFVPASVSLERGNHQQICAALVENGYYPMATTWGGRAATSLEGPSVTARGCGVSARADYLALLVRATAEDHRDTWLCALTVSGSGAATFADAIDAIIARYAGPGKRVVRQNADGSTTHLFQHDAGRSEAFAPLTLGRSKMDGAYHVSGTHTSIPIASKERAIVVLGADGAWRDDTPLTVARSELPVLDRNRADSLLHEFERFMDEPYTPPGIVEKVKRARWREAMKPQHRAADGTVLGYDSVPFAEAMPKGFYESPRLRSTANRGLPRE